MISSRLVRPLAAVVGWPFARLGGASGALARENAIRNPARTASTAAALMIGLALVTFVAALGAGLLDSSARPPRHQVSADYVVTSKNGWDPLSRAAGDAAAAAPGVGVASSVRQEQGLVAGDEVRVDGIDPATIAAVYHFDWSEGSDAALARSTRDGAIVLQKWLRRGPRPRRRRPVTIVNPAGTKRSHVVRGIYTRRSSQIDPLLGAIAISQKAFDSAFPRPKNLYTFVNAPGATAGVQTASLKRRWRPSPTRRSRPATSSVDDAGQGPRTRS